jgi:hypothetical protein
MDFMKLLKSLEELLYELVSWLVFYPITIWRTLSRPLEMMRYADVELADQPEDQYDDTLSPPLFLLITLLIGQAISITLPSVYDRASLPKLLSSDANLLIARGVIFSVFPLIMAVTLLRHRRVKLNRNTLRPPFYSQCYVAAPFAFGVGIGTDFLVLPGGGTTWIGLVALLLSFIWYGTVQVRWFRRDLGIALHSSIGLFLRSVCLATVLNLTLATVIGLVLKDWS